jgi:predicted dehydrogenase
MKIGIGVIGCGIWGRNFLRNFQASETFVIAGIADSDRHRCQEIASEWPDLPCVSTIEALLQRSDVEAVAIATPAATHFECARMALTADRHVLVAKPMTTSSRDAETLCELADRRRRVLMVDHTYVVSEGMRTIRAVLARGELTDVTRFDSVRRNISAARTDVNLIWDLAPHDLSILDAVFGLECEEMRVEADLDSPHDLRVALRYRGGRTARLDFGWAGPEKIRVVTLGSSTRRVVWDDLDREALVTLYETGTSPKVLSRPLAQETLLAVVEHFGAVISGRAASLMDGHHGLRVVRMLEKLQRAHDRSGGLARSLSGEQRVGNGPDVFFEP